jgi:hypothetical protein
VAVAYRGAGIGGTAAAAAAAVHTGAGLRARFMIAWAGVTRAPCGRAQRAACARRVGHAASLASIRLGAQLTGWCACGIFAAAAAAEGEATQQQSCEG